MDITTAKVLITGGGSGIGLETARQLLALGAQVVICGRNAARLAEAEAQLPGVISLQADVTDEASVATLFEAATQQMRGLNVLINNAGVGYMAPLVDTTLADFARVWETNVKGAFLAGREAARHFISQNAGNIVNIASTAGQRGFAAGTAYCASKFALSAMTECWRAELRKHNVRVMQVNPSEVVTPFMGRTEAERTNVDRKLKATEIAHTIVSMLQMNDVGFITDATVWATNP